MGYEGLGCERYQRPFKLGEVRRECNACHYLSWICRAKIGRPEMESLIPMSNFLTTQPVCRFSTCGKTNPSLTIPAFPFAFSAFSPLAFPLVHPRTTFYQQVLSMAA